MIQTKTLVSSTAFIGDARELCHSQVFRAQLRIYSQPDEMIFRQPAEHQVTFPCGNGIAASPISDHKLGLIASSAT